MVFTWLGTLPARGTKGSKKSPGRAVRRRPWSAWLEVLEDRIMPASVTWVGGSGDWDNAANWSDGAVNRLPGPDDDAVIGVAGISVTHSVGSHTVKSLTMNDPFALSDGTLIVSGNLVEQNGNI